MPSQLLCEIRSLHLFQQLPRFTQQHLNLPSLSDRVPAEHPMLASVPVCLRRAGSLCAAVHAAALLPVHRRRAARAAGARLGATTRARQHRAGVSDVIAHACASRLASAESRRHPEPAALAALIWKSSKVLSEFSEHSINGFESPMDRDILSRSACICVAVTMASP